MILSYFDDDFYGSKILQYDIEILSHDSYMIPVGSVIGRQVISFHLPSGSVSLIRDYEGSGNEASLHKTTIYI